jgi:hypothetical protein
MKYLGWSLSDKAASVRLCIVKALTVLYEDEEKAELLAIFTERFNVGPPPAFKPNGLGFPPKPSCDWVPSGKHDPPDAGSG